jgi:hypothetical protein
MFTNQKKKNYSVKEITFGEKLTVQYFTQKQNITNFLRVKISLLYTTLSSHKQLEWKRHGKKEIRLR